MGILSGGVNTAKSVGGIANSFRKGLFSFANPKSYSRDVNNLMSGIRQSRNLPTRYNAQALRKTAAASAVMLGKGSGIVMTGRLLSGRNPLKNKKGRFDVPFMPF